MSELSLDGARIAYRVSGDGPAIVLMRNNRRPVDLPVVADLSQRFRVLQIHPVGFGASDRPDEYDFGSIGDQVLAVCDHEGVDRFAVWGFSQTGAMAALVAHQTTRATALVMGGRPPIGSPTDAEMRRLEREPRLPHANLKFWRAYVAVDWHHVLRTLDAPTLIYIGTADKAINRLRRLRPVLEGIGCTYIEFNDLDHRSSGLDDTTDPIILNTITDWLDQEQVFSYGRSPNA
ncbi:alpha/beta fold hydrolase [Kribbella sp. NPDC050124]|uniref:alpha/beta fold hydrolase n=1 Tax=Kribbella sp. NPDC050124 TaxID=3364114 RepID=UPI00379A7603